MFHLSNQVLTLSYNKEVNGDGVVVWMRPAVRMHPSQWDTAVSFICSAAEHFMPLMQCCKPRPHKSIRFLPKIARTKSQFVKLYILLLDITLLVLNMIDNSENEGNFSEVICNKMIYEAGVKRAS